MVSFCHWISSIYLGCGPIDKVINPSSFGLTLELPAGAVTLRLDILGARASGQGVPVIPEDAELTSGLLKGQIACGNGGNDPADHFADASKGVTPGSDAKREVEAMPAISSHRAKCRPHQSDDRTRSDLLRRTNPPGSTKHPLHTRF